MKKVLVIGSGGREHALVWQLKQSPQVGKVFCAPGNAGIAADAECVDIKVNELDKLVAFAKENAIDFTVVGPEAPLCDGVVDKFQEAGLAIFGPDKAAAQLEGSKDFAKKFMLKYGIPTAASGTFDSADEACAYIDSQYAAGAKGIVVKADGLAAGKGVLVAENKENAKAFVKECFDGAFGAAGTRVVIEERLLGEEASILALTDGKTIVRLVSSQDHKRIYDRDKGPNTGGMGAYSPAPVVTDAVAKRIDDEILTPFLKGINAEKLNFKGVIFCGLMINKGVPKVLEFNVRFGDPEIQPVLRRFQGDWYDVLYKTATGNLDKADINWSDDAAVSVVIPAITQRAKSLPVWKRRRKAERWSSIAAPEKLTAMWSPTAAECWGFRLPAKPSAGRFTPPIWGCVISALKTCSSAVTSVTKRCAAKVLRSATIRWSSRCWRSCSSWGC